jgi:hypothetical protein
MRKVCSLPIRIALVVLACVACTPMGGQKTDDGAWTTEFRVENGELSATGRNPYFILEPGYQLAFEAGTTQLTITVLDETKLVAGVETRVVEEREIKDGKLSEVARNYFAISKRTNDVFYFGEDVDMYKDGQFVNHEGAWLAGAGDAKFGLIMPGQVLLNAAYYQELVPNIAMDRARIISINEAISTPAGEFANCLKIEETTPLDPGNTEFKYYAPGIGMVRDGSLKLVRYGKAE